MAELSEGAEAQIGRILETDYIVKSGNAGERIAQVVRQDTGEELPPEMIEEFNYWWDYEEYESITIKDLIILILKKIWNWLKGLFEE